MESRLRILSTIGAILFLVWISRLAQLQLVLGNRYFRLAETNRIRRVVITAPRGRIFDRNGILLATTRPAFSISCVPAETDSFAIAKLCSLLEISFSEIWPKIERNRFSTLAIKVKRNISKESMAKIEENSNKLSGISIEIEPLRYYPLAETACHIIGYVNEIGEDEIKKDSSYNIGSYLGRAGIEAKYEAFLRGYDGLKFIEVDSRGREVGPIYEKKPLPARAGTDLYLTIDAELQRQAFKALKNYKTGAVIGIDLSDGGVICLISKPGFDPNQFFGPLSLEEWNRLVANQGRPFFNRVTMGGYPPGSTFKPCVALAGLKKGILGQNSYFKPCTGKFQFGNRIFKCWTHHGRLNLIEAISQSCNFYFYQLGLKLGLDLITETALQCGFGTLTGIDLPEENKGLIPTQRYLDHRYGKNRWSKGILLNLGIGQGELLVTPLQLAVFYAAIAGNGEFFPPHLLKNAQLPRRCIKIDQKHWELVKEALFYAVESGTGVQAKIGAVEIAGKTGTAQNPLGEDHAWFVGYGGNPKPRVLFCVIIENAGKGGRVAAPIARELFRHYFRLNEIATQNVQSTDAPRH